MTSQSDTLSADTVMPPVVEAEYVVEPSDIPLDSTEGQPQVLASRIREKWNKLSDEDITLFHNQPENFYSRVEQTYGVNRVQAEAEMAAMCAMGASCSIGAKE